MNNFIILACILSFFLRANSFKDDPYDFGLELRALAENNGLNFLHKEVGQTVNNHTLQFFGITLMKQSQQFDDYKGVPAVFIDSLFHSRETKSFQFLKSVVEQIILESKTNQKIEFALRNSVFLFMPYVNIDSVIYVKEKLGLQNNQMREVQNFRKNMNFNGFQNSKCLIWQKGVDLNRNFDYNYARQKTSQALCGEQYRGKHPFSEKQTQAIKYAFQYFDIKIAISVHTYGNVWIYPYASEKSSEQFRKHRLFKSYQYIFQLFDEGSIKYASCFQELNYLADGVYIDWALNKNAVTFTLEMGINFTDLGPKKQIQRYIKSFIEMLSVMGSAFKYARTQSGNLCIDSYSVLPHQLSLSVNGQIIVESLMIQALQTKCIKVLSAQQQVQDQIFVVSIQNGNIKTEVELSGLQITQMQIKEAPQPQPQTQTRTQTPSDESLLKTFINSSTLTKVIAAVAIFSVIGCLCGMSIFCEKSVGLSVINQEKNQLLQSSSSDRHAIRIPQQENFQNQPEEQQ